MILDIVVGQLIKIAYKRFLQWGYISRQVYATAKTITFNIAFPYTCYVVIAQNTNANNTDDAVYGGLGIGWFNTTSFSVINGHGTAVPGVYVAIGR